MGNEKLRAVCARPGIRHREDAGLVVSKLRVEFVAKAIARTAAAGAGGIAALRHEVGNHAVENGAIVKVLAGQGKRNC